MSIVKDFLFQLVFIPTVIFTFQVFISENLKKPSYAKMIQSVLFGTAIVLCMTFRAHISPKFDLDIRIVPLLLGALFGGWEAGTFLSAVIILYRLLLGLNVGFYSTTVTLVLCMPVFVVFQKSFMKADKKKRIQIALILSVFYDFVGFTSTSLIESFSLDILRAVLIQLVITIVFVTFFVALNEIIKQTLSRNQQLQSEVKEAEIAFLRAQIKPHFLYNALNSISALCDIDPKRAADIIDDLAHYLRSRFDFGNLEKFVPLKKELDYINSYIKVEKARFGERLQVEYQINDGLDLWIPPLILQPIVENAVKHGLQDRLSGGLVTIVVRQTGADAEIRVSDNGKGIGQEKVDRIMEGTGGELGVGLTNVNARLKKLYGKGLTIVSEHGKGTTVTIMIPVGMQL